MLDAIRDLIASGRKQTFSLSLPHLSSEEKKHLGRMMGKLWKGNKDKLLFLPIDHGIEHGPSDFLGCPWALDPEYGLELAKEGNFSGIAIHLGYAEKYWRKAKYKRSVPLLLKLNGKTSIPSDDEAFSPLASDVSDAVKLGADAVGYTLYVGSSAQDRDIAQLKKVRQEAEKAGLPLVVWSYPRGKFVKEHGGKNHFAAVAYAARLADEMGADLVKINAPEPPKTKNGKYPKEGKFSEYNPLLALKPEEQLAWAVACAGSTGVLVSGGSKISDKDMLNKVKMSVEAGVNGLIFGRNMWQRPLDDALRVVKQVKKILRG